jgi:hypothetical protein
MRNRLDGFDNIMRHAGKRKKWFDRRVERKGGEVIFEKGQLVQIFCSDMTYTFSARKKIIPMWSEPVRVVEREGASYKLEELDGTPLKGLFSSERLRAFKVRAGSKLEQDQIAHEAAMAGSENEGHGEDHLEADKEIREADNEEEEVNSSDVDSDWDDGDERNVDVAFFEGGRCNGERTSLSIT